jgi:hypothetical protein
MSRLTQNVIEDLTAIRFLAKEEDIIGPYKFGVYDVLVLPPSFPYGGMVRLVYQPGNYLMKREGKCLSFVPDAQYVQL